MAMNNIIDVSQKGKYNKGNDVEYRFVPRDVGIHDLFAALSYVLNRN